MSPMMPPGMGMGMGAPPMPPGVGTPPSAGAFGPVDAGMGGGDPSALLAMLLQLLGGMGGGGGMMPPGMAGGMPTAPMRAPMPGLPPGAMTRPAAVLTPPPHRHEATR